MERRPNVSATEKQAEREIFEWERGVGTGRGRGGVGCGAHLGKRMFWLRNLKACARSAEEQGGRRKMVSLSAKRGILAVESFRESPSSSVRETRGETLGKWWDGGKRKKRPERGKERDRHPPLQQLVDQTTRVGTGGGFITVALVLRQAHLERLRTMSGRGAEPGRALCGEAKPWRQV